jgi:hypothetical protein
MTILKKQKPFAILVALFAAFNIGCATESVDTSSAQPTPSAELPADTGKADGIQYRVKDYFKNTLEISLDDLTDRVAHMATEEVNGLLNSVPFVDIKLGETQLFGSNMGTENGSTIHDLTSIVDGLIARYGNKSLVS